MTDEEDEPLMVTLANGIRIPKADFEKMKLTKRQRKMGQMGYLNRAAMRRKSPTRLTASTKKAKAPDTTLESNAKRAQRVATKNRKARKARRAR